MRDEIRELFDPKPEGGKLSISVTIDKDVASQLQEIQDMFNLNRSEVVNKILRYHLMGTRFDLGYRPRRGPYASKKQQEDRLAKIISDYEFGLTNSEIGLKYGISSEYVRQLLRKNGLPLVDK